MRTRDKEPIQLLYIRHFLIYNDKQSSDNELSIPRGAKTKTPQDHNDLSLEIYALKLSPYLRIVNKRVLVSIVCHIPPISVPSSVTV